MAGQILRDRIYSLIVGDEADAIEVNNLQMKFKVEKASNNREKKNTAYVEIYNLSEDRRSKLEQDYVQVSLSVGYAQTGLTNLFQGQVKNITTSKLKNFLSKREGTDIITRLEIDEMYTDLNGTTVSGFAPAGATVGSVIEKLSKSLPGVSRSQMNGTGVSTVLPSGYPMSGTPRQILDRLTRDYDIEWQIDQKVLYVSDQTGSFMKDTNSVHSFGQLSGLIDSPEYINEESKRLRKARDKAFTGKKVNEEKNPRSNALKFKVLLTPSLTAGSIIHLDFHPLSGYYKVDEVIHEGDFRGSAWYSTVRCSERND